MQARALTTALLFGAPSRFAVLLLTLWLTQIALACDRGWEYSGLLPSEVMCAIQNPADSRLLVGTYYNWGVPSTGGVYARVPNDTTWTYAGLIGKRVFQLAIFPSRSQVVFAVTSQGLFYFLGDTSWALVTRVGTTLGEQRYFAISPNDTSMWVISNNDVGAGSIYISNTSGQYWRYLYTGYAPGSLLFSRERPSLLYFTEGYSLRAINVLDSTVETVITTPYGIASLVFHPHEPFLYGLSSTGIIRYNEQTGDTIFSPTPFVTTYVTRIVYVTDDGLYFSSSNGIYRVSDDLTEWQPIEGSEHTGGWKFFYASSAICAASHVDTVFTVDRTTGVSSGSHTRIIPEISVFPNPSNGFLRVRSNQTVTFELYDLLGRRLVRRNMNQSYEPPVDLSSFPGGVYFYRLSYTYKKQVLQTGRVTIVK
jgi:hypothetical protein